MIYMLQCDDKKMAFTAQDVVKLREQTGAGMMDCKNALNHTNGDITKAVDYLREKGISGAAKKSARIASEGIVEAYVHMGGKQAVLVEVNCESDFVAKSAEFKELCHDIALQIAAFSPLYVSSEQIPTEELEREKNVLRAQAKNEGKPEAVIEKMLEGRVKKYYEEICLLNMPFCKDPKVTIQQLITNATAKIGEKITVRRFVNFVMGEGLEKKVNDLAADVASMTKK